MKNKKVIRDLKFYKKKLDLTITNMSALLSFFLIGYIMFKLDNTLTSSDSGLIILLVVVGIIALWFVFMSIIEFIIKLFAFGKSLK